jgi:hypothetical protein
LIAHLKPPECAAASVRRLVKRSSVSEPVPSQREIPACTPAYCIAAMWLCTVVGLNA